MLMFSTHQMKYFWYLPKKKKEQIFFLFYTLELRKADLTSKAKRFSQLFRFNFL